MYEIILLIILLVLVFVIVIYSLIIGISPMPTSKSVAKEINDLVVKNSFYNTIYDLGSGFGSLAIILAVKNPEKKVIGFEISPVPFYISKFLKLVLNIKNLEFYKKDFLDIDLNNKTLVCYLFPKGMELLELKITSENIKAQIISSTFSFRNISPNIIRHSNDIYKTMLFYYKID